jgi:hypothetical protein
MWSEERESMEGPVFLLFIDPSAGGGCRMRGRKEGGRMDYWRGKAS